MVVPLAGVLPFGSIFIEMYFILTSLWGYMYYYVYGFMLLVFTILVVVLVCTTIVAVYFVLNAEVSYVVIASIQCRELYGVCFRVLRQAEAFSLLFVLAVFALGGCHFIAACGCPPYSYIRFIFFALWRF